MLLRDLIEGRDGPLYHLMMIDKALAVFQLDEMPGQWEHDIPGLGKVRGNSLTRNARLAWGRYIRLVFDQRKLAQRYRIIPLDGEYVFRRTHGYELIRDRVYNMGVDKGRDPNWYEEFVIGDIHPLHRYLTGIELRMPGWSQIQMSGADLIHLSEVTRAYAERFSIPLRIDPAFEEKIAEVRQRWAEDD